MAHEITDTDNLFMVREPAWHGLGVVLPAYPTREEAQRLAHPWEPVTTSIYTEEPSIDPALGPVTNFQPMEGYRAVQRDDNGGVLGVVSNSFQTVSNGELWDIAEALQGSGVDVRYETAGSLKGGRKVWILLRLDEPLKVPGDPRGETIPYYALQNSHDGSGSLRGQATMMRIVCANTSHVADLDARARGTEFVFRHTKNVGDRVEDARRALAGWRDSLDDWSQLQEVLLGATMDDFDIETFIDRFIPVPVPGAASDRVRENATDAQNTFRSILSGVTCEGVNRTAYGLIAAATEYGEHYRAAKSRESQFHRSYLTANKVVSSASRIVRSLVSI